MNILDADPVRATSIHTEAKQWAKNDSLWTTQETVEKNLIEFAYVVTLQLQNELELVKMELEDERAWCTTYFEKNRQLETELDDAKLELESFKWNKE
jgi:hypothetical protein